jgi:hypothetical protein
MAITDDIRLLIPDLGEGAEQIFSDEQIASFAVLGEDDPFISTALALDVIATNEALTYKYVKTDDLTVDGVKPAALIMERARQMRQMALDAVNDEFEIVFPPTKTLMPPPEAAPWDYV